MPTQNLLRLLLLLMLIVRIMLATVCYRFGSWRLVPQTLSTRVGQDFEVEVQQDFETGACSAFCRWCFLEVMKLKLILNFKFIGDADVWLRCWCLVEILKMNLIKICVWTCDMTSRSYFDKMNSTLGSVVPLAMFKNERISVQKLPDVC